MFRYGERGMCVFVCEKEGGWKEKEKEKCIEINTFRWQTGNNFSARLT